MNNNVMKEYETDVVKKFHNFLVQKIELWKKYNLDFVRHTCETIERSGEDGQWASDNTGINLNLPEFIFVRLDRHN